MKSLTLRSSVALALALSLAGCGGGGGNLMLSGRVFGLTRGEVVLQNNGGPPLTVPANSSSYSFPELLRNDEDFNVTIKSAPASAVCTVSNAKGRTGAFSIQNADLICITNSYTLGGTITGNADGLVLVNGSDKFTVPAGATTFTMPAKVGDGSAYGVTILTQPSGTTCSVTNGVGVMGDKAVDTVQVNC